MAVLLLAVAGGAAAPAGNAVPGGPRRPEALVGPQGPGGIWALKFADEFDGTGVDPAKWSNGFGWGDTADNFAAWCDPAANVVSGGVLTQKADRLSVPHSGKSFSGGCLHTKQTFSQLYGYWEARVKVAAGTGLWSAFWGKPASEDWPPELDVMEIGGHDPDTVLMSAHWRNKGSIQHVDRSFTGPDFSAGYHVFGAEWTPKGTTWYVDGVKRAEIKQGAAAMDDKGPFYAMLDQQVGLQGAAQPTPTTPFPAYQQVDWVRIWQRPLAP